MAVPVPEYWDRVPPNQHPAPGTVPVSGAENHSQQIRSVGVFGAGAGAGAGAGTGAGTGSVAVPVPEYWDRVPPNQHPAPGTAPVPGTKNHGS